MKRVCFVFHVVGMVLLSCLALILVTDVNSEALSKVTENTGRKKMESTRKSVLAGSWYPGDKKELKRVINGYLENTDVADNAGSVYALISPHAGYRYSGQAAAYGYKTLQGKNINRVIILAPSHYSRFRGASILDVEYYETPLGKLKLDAEICARLYKNDLFITNKAAHQREHSLEIQLPFLQCVLEKFSIVPIVIGQLRKEDYSVIADALKSCLDSETIVVASSDFTHYGANFGYVPFRSDIKNNLAKLDGGAIDLIVKKDKIGFSDYIAKTGATICGRETIKILLEMLPSNVSGKELIYYTSGDLTGDYSSCVSYTSIIFTTNGMSE